MTTIASCERPVDAGEGMVPFRRASDITRWGYRMRRHQDDQFAMTFSGQTVIDKLDSGGLLLVGGEIARVEA